MAHKGVYPTAKKGTIEYSMQMEKYLIDRNICAECGQRGTKRKNYNMMWGEAELYCPNDHKIRDLDYG